MDIGGTMIYLEYESYKRKYLDLQEQFNEFLLEKERILTKTLPKAIRYDKDLTTTGVPDDNPLESYVMELERSKVDVHLDHIRKLLEDRKMLLDAKEKELRTSYNQYDRVYTMRYLDGYGIKRICTEMNFSRAQIYRILDEIKKKI